ncbi:PH domain-containing protein [Methanobrevibacter sp.]|uniref:PH domain-containing protein n=1 Tax=Methanobrevibacter sp. TaxID=66852 RepID=UPI002E76BCED|nr:PH domain-containing protein [Methanobrevibacter sp.]MEE1337243.1 PH domain-containing protein [Methanobrevibacter sp.]
MLFNRNDERANDRVIYNTKPNMILGCKKAIFGIILLIVILTVSPMVIKFIGQMQVYLISRINLSLTSYAAIAFFVVILIIVIYIIWQLVGWYSTEYTLTETKIIIKSGVISTKKNYMPYATIQDINTSQSIIGKMINVGSVSVFSAYDNNQLELNNISNPSQVEEIIFSRMTGSRNFQAPPQQMPHYAERGYRDESEYYPRNDDYSRREEYRNDDYLSPDDYLGRNEYYDEYEPITPITHERNPTQRRQYDYYPENFDNINNQNPRHTYEYEPYDSGFNKPQNVRQNNNQHNTMRDEYSYTNDDYYQNNNSQSYYDDAVEETHQDDHVNVDASSEKAIQRHFDKFKK